MTHHEGHGEHEGNMKKNRYPNFVIFVSFGAPGEAWLI